MENITSIAPPKTGVGMMVANAPIFGSSPISIPGLDDTGKNILFCAVLMIFGALFGVVHSTKGAVAVSFLAAALRYFELITIPWILIIVAATIAIIAALARGGGNN